MSMNVANVQMPLFIKGKDEYNRVHYLNVNTIKGLSQKTDGTWSAQGISGDSYGDKVEYTIPAEEVQKILNKTA